jgi:hypothetical protein
MSLCDVAHWKRLHQVTCLQFIDVLFRRTISTFLVNIIVANTMKTVNNYNNGDLGT